MWLFSQAWPLAMSQETSTGQSQGKRHGSGIPAWIRHSVDPSVLYWEWLESINTVCYWIMLVLSSDSIQAIKQMETRCDNVRQWCGETHRVMDLIHIECQSPVTGDGGQKRLALFSTLSFDHWPFLLQDLHLKLTSVCTICHFFPFLLSPILWKNRGLPHCIVQPLSLHGRDLTSFL